MSYFQWYGIEYDFLMKRINLFTMVNILKRGDDHYCIKILCLQLKEKLETTDNSP